jgi:tetratricopeptide (TPR) repeat protein
MICNKRAQNIATRIGFLHLAILLFLMKSPAWCAGPLMDGSIMDYSQSTALNSIVDGKFTEAIQAEDKALKIAEQQYGPLHPLLVPFYNNMGTLYRYMADYEKAEQDYKWGLALLEQNFGLKDPQLASTLENLASLYNELGRFTEAELTAKRALSIRESDVSQNPLTIAQTQALLALIEFNLHNNSQSQKLLQKSLTMVDLNSPANSEFNINLLNSLAQTYQAQQNYDESQSCLEKSMKIAQKNFHPDDIKVADTMDRLADFFHTQGLDEKAQPLYVSVLKIDQRYVGSVYTYLSLPYLKRMAKVYLSIGDPNSSETLWQKILQTEKEVYGPLHPQVALDLFQMAQVEWTLGKKQQAQKDIKESVEMLRSYFLADHPLVVEAEIQLKKFEK